MAETWLVEKAKKAKDSYARESWMLVAKTMLATGSYDLCVATYDLYFQRRNATEAADTLQKLYMKYSNDPRFWEEALKLTQAIEPKTENEDTKFRREVFQKLLPELQQSLLLDLADRTKELDEKCRQYLVCLRMFPDSIAAFGIELVRILRQFKDDNSNKEQTDAVGKNYYADILVTKVVPALLKCRDLPVPEDICLSLLKESVLFYTGSALNSHILRESADSVMGNLATVLQLTADRFEWTLAKSFPPFKFEELKSFLKKLRTADRERKRPETHYSALVTLAWLLNQYLEHPETGLWQGENKDLVLLVLPADVNSGSIEKPAVSGLKGASLPKKRKSDCEKFPFLERHPVHKQWLEEIFEVSLSCWELLFIKKGLIREVFGPELSSKVREMLTDAMMYEGQYEECAAVIEKYLDLESVEQDAPALFKLSSCCFALNRLNEAKKFATQGLEAYNGNLKESVEELWNESGWRNKVFDSCTVYLNLTDCLSYIVRIMVHSMAGFLVVGGEELNDKVIGHLIVLSQLNWPHYKCVFRRAVKLIVERKNFTYPTFFNYVRLLDIMEEIAFLSNTYDKLNLNITETEAARKSGLMNTRHSVKGAKDEIKQLLEIAVKTYTPSIIPGEIRRFLVEQKQDLID